MKKRILGILSAAMVVLLSTPLAGCGGIKEKDADWVELSTWFLLPAYLIMLLNLLQTMRKQSCYVR